MNLHRLNRILLETLLLPVVALMLVSGALVMQILRTHNTVNRIQTVDRNIANANLVAAYIADEETGVRGYQNTSNEIFLQPYQISAAPLEATLNKLKAGIGTESGDLRLVDQLMLQHR